jgi:hypothetical protein
MTRELIMKNEIINENQKFSVTANADGRTPCSPAAYQRLAPIGGCLYKKLLDLSSQKLNILRNKGKFNIRIIVIGEGAVSI